MIALSKQETVCVNPNKIGNVFGENHSQMSLPTAIKAKEAPRP